MSNVIIEDRIRDHYNVRILDGKSDCDYRVNPDDFIGIAERLDAEIDPAKYFITLIPTSGPTRVYPSEEVGRGAYEPCELSEPRAYVLGRRPPAVLENPIDFAALKKDRESTPFVFTVPIAVGDVVRLKSGGAWMTVETISSERANCVWQPMSAFSSGLLFSSSRDTFPLAALEKRSTDTGV